MLISGFLGITHLNVVSISCLIHAKWICGFWALCFVRWVNCGPLVLCYLTISCFLVVFPLWKHQNWTKYGTLGPCMRHVVLCRFLYHKYKLYTYIFALDNGVRHQHAWFWFLNNRSIKIIIMLNTCIAFLEENCCFCIVHFKFIKKMFIDTPSNPYYLSPL